MEEKTGNRDWMVSWDDGKSHYDTNGNQCPRCGEEHPDHIGVRDTIIYGASDALEIGCRCRRCSLEFNEYWMWLGGENGRKSELRYSGTIVASCDDTMRAGEE